MWEKDGKARKDIQKGRQNTKNNRRSSRFLSRAIVRVALGILLLATLLMQSIPALATSPDNEGVTSTVSVLSSSQPQDENLATDADNSGDGDSSFSQSANLQPDNSGAVEEDETSQQGENNDLGEDSSAEDEIPSEGDESDEDEPQTEEKEEEEEEEEEEEQEEQEEEEEQEVPALIPVPFSGNGIPDEIAFTVADKEIECVLIDPSKYGFSLSIPVTFVKNGLVYDSPAKVDFLIFGGNNIFVTTISGTLNAAGNAYVLDGKVPVYVVSGTESNEDGNFATYETPAGFYKVGTAPTNSGYSVTGSGTLQFGLDDEQITIPVVDVDLSVNPNSLVWTASASTITFRLPAMTTASFTVEWTDNNNNKGKRPTATVLAGTLELYCFEDDTLTQIKSDNYGDFGFLVEPAFNVATTGTGTSYSNWRITCASLPDVDGREYYFRIADIVEATAASDYRNYYLATYTDGVTIDGATFAKDDGKVTNVYTQPITGILAWYDVYYRGEEINPRPDDLPLHLFLFDSDKVEWDLVDENKYTLEWTNKSEASWSYSITELEIFDADGVQLIYSVRVGALDDPYTVDTDKKDAGEDDKSIFDSAYYAVAYDNKQSSTDHERCYDGGEILLVLKDEASLEAKKVWYDGSDTTRRGAAIDAGIELLLWRYPSGNDKGAGAAAAVTVGGTQLSHTITAGDVEEDGSTIEVDFELFDQYVSGTTLPMYDECGDKYVYFVTEVLPPTAAYRQAFYSIEDGTRLEGAAAILADGVELRNIRSDQSRMTATKQWMAQGEGDYRNSTVVLEIQQKTAGGWETVKYPGSDEDAIKSLTGFTTSIREKTAVFDPVELYDDWGDEIEFRIVEKMDGVEFSEYKEDPEDSGIWVATYEYAGSRYAVTCEEVEDGVWMVENRLAGTLDYRIVKEWRNGSGNGEVRDITIEIWQDDRVYATASVDKEEETVTVKGAPDSDDGVNGTHYFTASGAELSPTWTFDVLTLPAYNEDGKAYVYTVKETAGTSGWSTYYSYEKAGNTTTATVSNRTYGTGGTTQQYMRISKVWNDDGNASQREEVTVTLVKMNEDGTCDTAVYTAPTAKLNPGNNWERYIWYDTTELDNGQYWVVVETVGDREGVPHANYKTGTVPAGVDGDVAKPGYSYTVTGAWPTNSTSSSITITNTPKGEVQVDISKIWRDSGNSENSREDFFVVKLYKDGTYLREIEWEIAEEKDKNNNHYTGSFTGLDMYDENGVTHSYTVAEFFRTVTGDSNTDIPIKLTDSAATSPSGYVAAMTQETVETVDDGVLKSTWAYEFTNTAAGESSPQEFYVLWRDETNQNDAKRPDVSYTLYYKVGDGDAMEYKPYPGVNNMKIESAQTGARNPFYQKITFTGMEGFDENGNAYEFYLGQIFVNDALGLYRNTYYESNDAVDTADGIPIGETGLYHYPLNGPEPSTADGLAPAGGLIVNTIYDDIVVFGPKAWRNTPTGITSPELPEAVIYLWRESPYVDTNKAPDDKTSTNGNLGKTELSAEKDGYRFEDETGALETYPKYDDYGARYEYTLTEIVTNTDGKPIPNVIMLPTAKVFSLTNVYNPYETANKRSITVEKTWAKIPSGITAANYPAVKYQLYRGEYAPNISGNWAQISVAGINAMPQIYPGSAEAAEHPGNGVYLVEERILRYGGTASGSLTWADLPICAPNGNVYVYFVCEVLDFSPSYDATNTTVDAASHGTGSIANTGHTNLLITLIGNNAVDLKTNGNVATNQDTASYTNTYNEANLRTLTGTKAWDDGSNVNGVRPAIVGTACGDIIISLTRASVTQAGQGNSMSKTYAADEFTVEWTDVGGDSWSYVIKPAGAGTFPAYAPNGEPYTYTVTESYKENSVLEKNYTIANGTSKQTVTDGIATAETMALVTDLKNALESSITVEKYWTDGYDGYRIRETSLTVQLERRVSDQDNTTATVWEPVGNPATITDDGKGNWKTTFTGLALTNSSGAAYVYRVVETKIGDFALNFNPWSDDGAGGNGLAWESAKNAWVSKPAGAVNYTVTHSGLLTIASPGGSVGATLTNYLSNTVNLTVNKTWAGDSDDKYGARPEAVTLRLQWKFKSARDDSWTDLVNPDGGGYQDQTIGIQNAVSGNPNAWRIIFTYLPASMPDTDDGNIAKEVQYRALEMDGGTPLTTTGDELDSYKMTAYSDADNTTSITNTLVTRTAIAVEKKWNTALPGSAVIVQLYSDNFDAQTGGTTGMPIGKPVTLNAGSQFKGGWDDLPLLNPDQGTILYYLKETSAGGSAIGTNGNTANSSWHVNYYVDGAAIAEGGMVAAPATGASTISVVNTQLVTASVEKVWDDASDKYNLRPSSVTLTLQRRTTVDGQADDAGWSDLTHEAVKVYTGSTATGNITLTLNSTGAWKGSVSRLPSNVLANGTGTAYEYRFVEKTVPDGYEDELAFTRSATTGAYSGTITNSLTLSTPSFTVTKVWDDDSDRDGIRPASITLELLYENSGGNFVSFSPKITQSLNAASNWTWAIAALPAGLSYSLAETLPAPADAAYSTVITPSSFDVSDADANGVVAVTVENSYTPKTVSIEVEKIWAGEGTYAAKTRPAIEMTLYQSYTGADGSTVKQAVSQTGLTNPVVISDRDADNTSAITSTTGVTGSGTSAAPYTYTWSDLPAFIRVDAATQTITYTVEETAYTGHSLSGYASVSSTASNSNTDTNTNLVTTDKTVTFTNTLIPLTWTVTKEWNDYKNAFGTRPDSMTFALYAREGTNGTDVLLDDTIVERSAATDDEQTFTITGLPACGKTGEAYFYTVHETGLDFGASTGAIDVDYEDRDDDDDPDNPYLTAEHQDPGNKKTTVTNTWKHLDDFLTLLGTKEWDDGSNSIGSRPDTLHLTVYSSPATASPRVWTKYLMEYDIEWIKNDDNTWDYAISPLPKYDSSTNEELVYSVKEDGSDVPDYYQRTSADTYNEGIVDPTDPNKNNRHVANSIVNKLLVDGKSLIVAKTKDRGPADVQFTLRVMLASSPIGGGNLGMRYTGGYIVYALADDTLAKPLRTGTATNGDILISADEKFVITGLPAGYYYTVEERNHNDYQIDAQASQHLKGQISGTVATEVHMVNRAKTELAIENTTPNPADSTKSDAGGKVVVRVVGDEIPQDADSDGYKQGTVQVAWMPDLYWNLGSVLTIHYTEFASTAQPAPQPGSITIHNFSISEGQTIFLQDLQFATVAERNKCIELYAGASVTMANSIVTMSLGTLADMPRRSLVSVAFEPTLAVNNITHANAGGTVQVEGGTQSTNADGVPAYGGVPYVATTVHGVASAGYRLDDTVILLRNLNDLDGHCQTIAVQADNTFSTSIVTAINDAQVSVHVTGKVVYTHDEGGNIMSAVLRLDSLPVPLQIDLLFVPVVMDDHLGSGLDSNGGAAGNAIPRTGDNANLLGWVVLACLAIAGVLWIIVRRRNIFHQ